MGTFVSDLTTTGMVLICVILFAGVAGSGSKVGLSQHRPADSATPRLHGVTMATVAVPFPHLRQI